METSPVQESDCPECLGSRTDVCCLSPRVKGTAWLSCPCSYGPVQPHLHPTPWAPSASAPRECQRAVLGGQWDSPSAEGSLASCRSDLHCSQVDQCCWGTGRPAGQVGRNRARRWQSGAHPGWRPGHKLVTSGGGPLAGRFGPGQGHPGLP